MPTSIARLLFMTWKAPPIINRKAMMPACCSNPLSKAVKTCHVWGVFSTAWNELSIITVRSVPFTTKVSRAYSPAGMTQDSKAQSNIITEIIV